MLSRLARGPHEPTPVGVFRDVVRPDYGEGVDAQIGPRSERAGPGDLATLLRSGATWGTNRATGVRRKRPGG